VTQTAKHKSSASFAPPSHSLDFTSVDWFGQRYTFRPGQQAKAIELLWAEWVRGDFCLSEKTIGDRIGSSSDNFRLLLLFESSKLPSKKNPSRRRETHPAWGVMIVRAGAGLYKLSAPARRRNVITK
jgi:hypothetical protein